MSALLVNRVYYGYPLESFVVAKSIQPHVATSEMIANVTELLVQLTRTLTCNNEACESENGARKAQALTCCDFVAESKEGKLVLRIAPPLCVIFRQSSRHLEVECWETGLDLASVNGDIALYRDGRHQGRAHRKESEKQRNERHRRLLVESLVLPAAIRFYTESWKRRTSG